ncbi:MAG: MoaD/ThiS family protein [Polyangiaceae bacterium]|nr:MoaD/ThiS family protein [Polyangiaceae bacterium]
MQVTVRVPGPLRSLTCGERELIVCADTVRGAIDAMEQLHPGIRDQLLDARGVRRFINIFLDGEDIRSLDGLETRLEDGDQLDLVPALAGG